MKLIVKKSRLSGTAVMPASKSHTIRAVAIASLAKGVSKIHRPLISNDTLCAVNCYRMLGADIETDDDTWTIKGTAGRIKPPDETIDVGNSGTTLRLAISSAALAELGAAITFTGDEQIQSRPVGPLLNSLNDLGACAESLNNNGKPPVRIAGKLIGGQTSIECFTSQYLSSLLLASPLALKDTTIDVPLLNEPGYVQMTLDWLDKQGVQYENTGLRQFTIAGGQHYKSFKETIAADFSSATFFLCAAALCGEDVSILGLDFADSQPDKAVADYLRQMGADIQLNGRKVKINAAPLKGVEIDMNQTPDALPAIAVTAAFASGTTVLKNVPQARNKETDRISCMTTELRKMGVEVEELPDGMIIKGTKPKAARLAGHKDHRIVMALAVAAMAADDCSLVDDAEAASVTFPNFTELMQAIGASIELRPG